MSYAKYNLSNSLFWPKIHSKLPPDHRPERRTTGRFSPIFTPSRRRAGKIPVFRPIHHPNATPQTARYAPLTAKPADVGCCLVTFYKEI